MKKLTFTQKIFAGVLGVNILVFGVYGFLYWKIQDQSKKTSVLLAQEITDRQKDDSLRAIKISLDENKDFISQIDSFFIAPDGVVNFITSLEKLGRESGVGVNVSSVAVAPDAKVANDFKESLKLKLDVSGSWQDVLHFLSRIENLPYRVQFDGASVTLQKTATGINFTSSSTPRKRSGEEEWVGSFDVRFLKLK